MHIVCNHSLSAAQLPAAKLYLNAHFLPIPEDLQADLVPGPLLIQHFKQISLQLDLLAINACDDIPQNHTPKVIPAAAGRFPLWTVLCMTQQHETTFSLLDHLPDSRITKGMDVFVWLKWRCLPLSMISFRVLCLKL